MLRYSHKKINIIIVSIKYFTWDIYSGWWKSKER